MQIRRIGAEEAPVVRELYRAMVAEAAERHPDEGIGISERGLDNLETHFRVGAVHEDVLTLVAESGSQLLGFALAEVTRSRALPGAAGEITELWVRPGSPADLEELLAREAIRLLRERGAGPVFHHADASRCEDDPWRSLGFTPDVIRFSLYE